MVRFSGCMQFVGGNSNKCNICKPGYKQIEHINNDWCEYSPDYWSFSLTKKTLMGFGKYIDKDYNEIDGVLDEWNLISLIDVTSPEDICIACQIEYEGSNYFSGNTTYLKLCYDKECILFYSKTKA
jgi:hypothetical protein